MSRTITKIEYNWYAGNCEEYEVGKDYWINDVEDSECIAITELDNGFMAYFKDNSQVLVKNINKVFYKEICHNTWENHTR